jgi:uncharacterized PurR-regulated membrane protein YhhQ (DUF165 family)
MSLMFLAPAVVLVGFIMGFFITLAVKIYTYLKPETPAERQRRFDDIFKPKATWMDH